MAECIGVPTRALYALTHLAPNIPVNLESKFEARDIRWAPDGKGLLLVDKGHILLCIRGQRRRS